MRSVKPYIPGRLNTATAIDIWIARNHQGFLDVGWVQTNDSGQLEGSTVVPATNTDQYLGYRIYEINDKYSADSPVFVKVNFYVLGTTGGTNESYNPYAPYVCYQVGFATDGDGNFVGSYTPTSPTTPTKSVYTLGPAFNTESFSFFTKVDGFTAAITEYKHAAHGMNLLGSNFFALERVVLGGEVLLDEVIYVHNHTAVQSSARQPFAYSRLSKGGVTGPFQHPSHNPRASADANGLIAVPFDFSTESGLFESNHLVALRAGSDFGEVELSFDGVTSKKFILFKSSTITGAGTHNLGVLQTSGGLVAAVDTREIAYGVVGVGYRD